MITTNSIRGTNPNAVHVAEGKKARTVVPGTLGPIDMPAPLPGPNTQASIASPPAPKPAVGATSHSSSRTAGVKPG